MNEQLSSQRSDGVAWPGMALILVGAVLLASQLGGPEWLGLGILPSLAGVFAIWGFAGRTPALLVPAGILAGIGAAGIAGYVGAPPAVIIGCVGVGFLLVALLTRLAGSRDHWWSLIPGSIIGAVAVAIGLESSEAIWRWVGTVGAVTAIVVGFALLTWSVRRHVAEERSSA